MYIPTLFLQKFKFLNLLDGFYSKTFLGAVRSLEADSELAEKVLDESASLILVTIKYFNFVYSCSYIHCKVRSPNTRFNELE